MKQDFLSILGPSSPARGMISAQDPSILAPGYYSRLENLRCQNGTLGTRDGALAVVSSGPTISGVAASSLLGLFNGTLNGTNGTYAAFWFGGAVSKAAVFGLGGSSWTEVTNSSTRFATNAPIQMAIVRDGFEGLGTQSDILVMGNGTDAPRISNGVTSYTQIPITLPTFCNAVPSPYAWFNFSGSNALQFKESDGTKFAGSNTDVATKGFKLTLNLDPANGTQNIVLFPKNSNILGVGTSNSGSTLPKEICVLATDPTLGKSLWDYVTQVDAYVDEGTSLTVSTEANSGGGLTNITTTTAHGLSVGDLVRVEGVVPSTNNATWRVEAIVSATVFTTNLAWGSYTSGGIVYKLTPKTLYDQTNNTDALTQAAVPSTAVSISGNATMGVIATGVQEGATGFSALKIYVNLAFTAATLVSYLPFIGTSGNMDGAARWAGSYYNSTTRAESVSALAVAGSTRNLALSGPSYGQYYQWNPQTDFFTAWSLAIADNSTALAAADYAFFYLSLPVLEADGSTSFTEFYWSTRVALTGGGGFGFTNKYVNSETVNITRVAPEVGHTTIPYGAVLCSVNDRLWVGCTSVKSDLWVSADKNPFAFRQSPLTLFGGEIDPTSGSYRTFQGQTVTGMLRMQGTTYGVDDALLWTNQGLYRLGGFNAQTVLQAARLSEHGTLRPSTISSYESTVWYLDTENEVRVTSGGMQTQAVTLQKVDDLLESGTLTSASGASGFNGYRLFFTESGGSGNYVGIVWEKQTGEWVMDRYPFAIAGTITTYSEPKRKMLAVTSAGLVYQLEVPGQTTDAGTSIPIVAASRELSFENWMSVTFGAVGVVVDGSVNTTLTTTRTTPYLSTTYTGSIDLTTAALTTAQAWRWDTLGSSTPVCPSCIVKINGNLLGGKRLRSFVVKVRMAESGPDRA